MPTPLLEHAIRNYAHWCETITSHHGFVGRFDSAAWINEHPIPPYFPNVITLSPDANMTEAQHREIAELSKLAPKSEWLVKDSYASLDLSKVGFEKTFLGQWVSYTPTLKAPPKATRLRFEVVSSPEALKDWEAAWRGPHGVIVPGGVFRRNLLEEDRILILSGWVKGVLACGFILNFHDGVVGLTNVFRSVLSESPESGPPLIDQEELIRSALHESVKSFKLAPLVSYVSVEGVGEKDSPTLDLYEKAGFEKLGPIQIWRKVLAP